MTVVRDPVPVRGPPERDAGGEPARLAPRVVVWSSDGQALRSMQAPASPNSGLFRSDCGSGKFTSDP